MTAVRSVAAEAAEFGKTFGGTLMRPGDAGYERARKVHNGLINKRPALIAQCRDTSDVTEAIRLTQRLGLEVAVRGGGHNVAGRATIDGGVMIDLSPMKGIQVDPDRRRVRAQGGVTWAELNRETQRHGLAVTGGVVSSTGIAGLTLGGGLGWLMGKYGLALDNLVSLELVDARGKVINTSKTDKPDLFWASRGGGGNLPVWSADNRSIIIGYAKEGKANVGSFDAASGKLTDVTTGNQAVVSFRAIPDASKFALLISTPTRIGDLYWLDKAGAQPKQLTHINDDLFSKLNLTEPDEIWHNSFDGRKIQVWVQKPPDFEPSKKYPVFQFTYAGPHALGESLPLRQRGLLVLAQDVGTPALSRSDLGDVVAAVDVGDEKGAGRGHHVDRLVVHE